MTTISQLHPHRANRGKRFLFARSKPSNVANKDAKRDFTFSYYVYAGTGAYTPSSNDVLLGTLKLHVGYAEIVTQFAGEGEFVDRLTVGGPDEDNVVVVGQKVHAKVETSSKVSVDTGSIKWSEPSGGNVVRNYITETNIGEVVPLTTTHRAAAELEFYNVTNDAAYCSYGYGYGLGSLSATMNVTLANGKKINDHQSYSTYYVGMPTGVSLSATQTGTEIRYFQLRLADSNTKTEGMTFTASVTTTPYAGGEVGFMQTVIAFRSKVEENAQGVPEAWIRTSGDNISVLDKGVPYEVKKPGTKEKDSITAGNSATIDTVDSPFFDLVDFSLKSVLCADIFTMYVIYKPTGTNSIWVPIKALDWTWYATAYEAGGMWYDNTSTSALPPSACGTSYNPTNLPTWAQNVSTLSWVKVP